MKKKKIIVYYTEKDYLLRKPNLKYMQYKYIENEALSLNIKKNIKAYVIYPGFIYGYGEKTFEINITKEKEEKIKLQNEHEKDNVYKLF